MDKKWLVIYMSLIISGCGTTGLVDNDTEYVMVSVGCAGGLSALFTGEVCYCKATDSVEGKENDIDWKIDFNGKDDCKVIGRSEGSLNTEGN